MLLLHRKQPVVEMILPECDLTIYQKQHSRTGLRRDTINVFLLMRLEILRLQTRGHFQLIVVVVVVVLVPMAILRSVY